MSPKSPYVPALVLALMAALATAGCGNGDSDGDDGTEPALGPVPVIDASSDLPALPLDPYLVHTEQRRSVQDATRIAAKSCMSRFGFDWHGNDPTPQPNMDELAKRRYGLIDSDVAATYGYQAPPSASGDDGTTGRNKGGFNPSQDELAVWRGTVPSGSKVNQRDVPAGGCQGEVDRIMEAGAPRSDTNLAQNLSADSYSKSRNDSRLAAAQAKWSACMKESGYTFRDSIEANEVDWAKRSRADQIATAKADVACRKKTNLVGVWFAVDQAYQKRLVEKHAEQLELVRKQLDAELRNAAAVLSGKRPS